jgi:histidine triad (HIT) family protein
MKSVHDCIFCRIVRGEIPARKVHEDEHILAFHDINPSAPVHFLVIPRTHIENFYEVAPDDQALLGHLFGSIARLARSQGLDDGCRVIVNNGRIGRQEVYHLHVHVLGGPEPLGSMMGRR